MAGDLRPGPGPERIAGGDQAAEGEDGEVAALPPSPGTLHLEGVAIEVMRLLACANVELHQLARCDPSSEATEAIDAIQRAKRLVSTRYLA